MSQGAHGIAHNIPNAKTCLCGALYDATGAPHCAPRHLFTAPAVEVSEDWTRLDMTHVRPVLIRRFPVRGHRHGSGRHA